MKQTIQILIMLTIITTTLLGLYITDKNIKETTSATLSPVSFTSLTDLTYNKPVEPIVEYIFEATAYTLSCGNGDGYTATMTRPIEGRTVAVDPSVIPYGTKLSINGVSGYIAEDCGGAIKGNKVDIFMDSYNDAITFGRQSVIITID